MKIMTLFKLALLGAVAMVAGVTVALAQTNEPLPADTGETFIVWAGGNLLGQSNTRFYTAELQIHRGDTVTWQFYGPHNVHFRVADGPAAFEANIESGAVFQGEDANSGILNISANPDEPTEFSLVFDVDPGVYEYLCDIHPGMRGTIEVVADDVEILTPSEVLEVLTLAGIVA